MTDYTKLKDADLLHAMGDDAMKWATAFKQLNPGLDIGEDVMVGWFANAIEHSTDIRTGRVHNGDHAAYLLGLDGDGGSAGVGKESEV